MLRSISLVALLAITLALAGCDKSIHGKYSGTMEGDTITIDFRGDGKCTMTFAQAGGSTESTEGTYTERENTITIESKGVPMSFTLDGDTLTGPMGMKLVRS